MAVPESLVGFCLKSKTLTGLPAANCNLPLPPKNKSKLTDYRNYAFAGTKLCPNRELSQLGITMELVVDWNRKEHG